MRYNSSTTMFIGRNSGAEISNSIRARPDTTPEDTSDRDNDGVPSDRLVSVMGHHALRNSSLRK